MIEELVVIGNIKRVYFCEPQAFIEGSEEAIRAHDTIISLKKTNKRVVDINKLTKEDIEYITAYIDGEFNILAGKDGNEEYINTLNNIKYKIEDLKNKARS